MRILSWTILAAFGLAALNLAPMASAQSAPAPASIASVPSPAIAAVVSAVMPALNGMSPVKGLPFSATQTTVHEQALADGTVIKSTVEVELWRDSEGRMRAESTIKPKSADAPETHVVAVWNPTERKEMSWVTGSQSATIATVLRLPELQMNGMMSALAAPPAPAPPGTLFRLQQTPAAPAALTSPASREAPNTHTESLGPDTIGGMEVTGTRTAQVIPAGSIDNDRDFSVTSETWTSPELKITVRQTTSDPRTGTVTTELTNIDRSDPDPALFKPPAGSRLMDIPDPTAGGSGGKR